jgi:hypothetical protein
VISLGGTSSLGTVYSSTQVIALLSGPSLTMRWYFDLLSETLAYKVDLSPSLDESQPAVLSYDASRAVKRELRLRMRANSSVNPLRDLLRLRYEIRTPDGGTLQWVIGIFMFAPPSKEIHETYTWWSVSCPDASQFLADSAFANSTAVPAGTHYPTAIRQIVSSYGGTTPLSVSMPLPPATVPASLVWDAGATRLKAVNDLIGAVNYTAAYMNGTTLVSNPQPDFNRMLPTLVLDTITGQAQVIGPLTEVADYVNAFNQVRVIGQDPRRNPIYAYRENTRDDSPVSLRNWRPRLKVINDSAIADQAHADARAFTELQISARIYSALTVGTVPFPFFEDLDTVTLAYSSTDEGVVRRQYLVIAGSHTCSAGVPTTGTLQRLVAA